VIHATFTEAMEIAKERQERIPSSAAAPRDRAQNILSVRNKLLDLMPHVDRRNYAPYSG
jgi:hypothetical protein